MSCSYGNRQCHVHYMKQGWAKSHLQCVHTFTTEADLLSVYEKAVVIKCDVVGIA